MQQHASSVVDLSAVRKQREFRALVRDNSPDVPAFDWDDVTFYGDTDEPVDDTIVVYGNRAMGALMARMARCGLTELPLRYRELLGTLAYCAELLDAAVPVPGHTEKDRLAWQASQLAVCAEHTPELLASLRAVLAGDLAELQRIGREVMTLPVLAEHFVIEKGSWIGEPGLAYLARQNGANAAD